MRMPGVHKARTSPGPLTEFEFYAILFPFRTNAGQEAAKACVSGMTGEVCRFFHRVSRGAFESTKGTDL